MKKNIFGMLLVMESLFMAFALVVSFYYNYFHGETDFRAMAITTVTTLVSGLFLVTWSHGKSEEDRKRTITRRDSLLIVSLTWVVYSFFGMMPFLLYDGLEIDVASAYFETMSGFTTTGATVLTDIDVLPHGLLLWRSITQWMGGLGIVVFSFALIPVYEMKNSNMYQAEVTGISLDKLKPKIGDTARRLLTIYLFLSILCATAYWIGPMNLYDAINHSMTTIATGGYSTHTASIGYYHSSYVEYVASFFMIISSINFSLYYFLSIRRAKVFARNEEMQAFLWIVLFSIAIFCLLFHFAPIHHHNPEALMPGGGENLLRAAIFHVSTVISSTGYQGEYFDYVGWGASFWMPTVLIMAVGSCAGSTAGGIKVVRFLLYIKVVLQEFRLMLHPRAVTSIKLNGQVVPHDRVSRAMGYIIMYTLLSVFGIVIFTMLGVDVDSAIGACISSLSNVGPGTGVFGPASNFSAMHEAGKWLLSFYMLVGRLEIFTVLFILLPGFWERK